MQVETSELSHVVIKGLEASAEELRNDARDEAARRLLEIQDIIRQLSWAAATKKQEARTEQELQTHLLASVLESETDVHNRSLELQTRISRVIAELSKAHTNEAELYKQMGELQKSLDGASRQMEEHQARLRERARYLNDTSVESIFRSIVALGFDRLGVAIQTAIEDDARAIAGIHAELARIVQEYNSHREEVERGAQLLGELEGERQSYENAMAELKTNEASLQELEKAYRAKVTFLTEIDLFYGRLAIIASDAQHRVSDVSDVVEELNDTTPRITDVDTSGEVLVSLKEALHRFDEMVRPSSAGGG